jgi:tetratricopeptide (TPR) repeat protein
MLKKTSWLMLTLLAGTALIYYLGKGGPLVLDDMHLNSLNNLQSGVVPWYAVVMTNSSGTFGRPVSMLSFLLNYWTSGFNVDVFKLTNIALHLTCGFLFFLFFKSSLRDTTYSKHADWVALLSAACWLLSPFFSSTVLYVVQRMAILSSIFVLLSLLAYLRFRNSLVVGRFDIFQLLLFFLSAILGVLSKESAALIPLFILVIEFFFCTPIHDVKGRRWLRSLLWMIVFVPIVLAIGLVLIKNQLVLNYDARAFTLDQRLLTEPRILWSYIGELLVPTSSNFGLFHDDVVISKGLLNPFQTLLAIVGWIATAVGLFFARKNQDLRPIAGGIAFFMVGHAMESTIFPLELYFEHRNYLPGGGIYLAVILSGSLLIDKGLIKQRVAHIAIIAYLSIFAVALSQRALIWSSYITLMYSSLESHPNSSRAWIETALLDAQLGRFDSALTKLQKVRQLTPDKLLGVNIQEIYTYCLFNKPGLENKMQGLILDVDLDSSTYTSTAVTELNELYRKSPCVNVPYSEYVLALSERLKKFYDGGEYRKLSEREVRGISTIQLRTLEGLNFLAKTDKTLDLADSINRAEQGGFAVDILTTVALIDRNKLDEAGALLSKLKQDKNMFALMEAGHLASVDQMYQAQLLGEK